MSETLIFKQIQLELSKLGHRLWRNNCGMLQDSRGVWVKYGIANPGGSDGIGFITKTVTQDMVGQKVAIFLAIEVKDKGNPTPEQINFIIAINRAGGKAFIAHSSDEAVRNIT